MDSLKTKFNSFKQKPVLVYGMGCLLLFIFSVLLTYYLRVVYSPSWLTQLNGTVSIFALSALFWTVFYFSSKLKNKNLFMTILLFALGLFFCFATPPNQVPDEEVHFLRSYAMAQGEWGFDENHEYPADVIRIGKCFPTMYNNGYPAKENSTIYNRFSQYYDSIAKNKDEEKISIIIFQVIPYIPGALGIFIANILGFTALGAYYASRIANLAFFCFCAYFALKYSGKFKILMFTVMAMPLVSFIVASCNTDSFLFRIMFLMFGTILNETFNNKMAMIFSLCFAILCMHKMSYIVFLPLIFCISKDKWKLEIKDKKIKKSIYAVMTVLLLFVFNKAMGLYIRRFSNFGVIERTMTDSNPMLQLKFILSNPLRYAAIFFDTLKNNSFFLFSGGLFGWLDVKIPLINYLTPVIVLLATVKQANIFRKEDLSKTIWFFICGILTYGVVMTGLYITWTPVTLPQIIGLQMRYMVPAFLGFMMVIGQYFSNRTDKHSKSTDYSCICTSYIFTISATVLMLIVYYLPERAVAFVA